MNNDAVKNVWRSFSDLGIYESNVLDTTDLTVDESVKLIRNMLLKGVYRIK